MNSGANGPGQPMMGQRSIFGTGRGTVFAHVPAYTPVTRGSEPQQQHLPDPRPDYGAYARQGGADQQPTHSPGVSGYASPNGAAQSYQSPNAPARTYTTPDFPNPFPPQSYQPQPPQRPQSPPSPIPASEPGHSYQPEPSTARSFQDAGFPERIFPAEAAPSAGYAGQGFADPNYPDASFGGASFPDAGFPDASFEDASFPEEKAETGFAGAPSVSDAYSQHAPLRLDDTAVSNGTEAEYDPLADQTGHDYALHAQHGGMGAGPRSLPSHQALQTFDAVYDQPPQIALGGIKYPQQSAPQGFYEGEQPDADFLDESQFTSGAEDAGLMPARKMGLRSRSIFMVGSALLGAVALGGALAYAYKQSGGAMGGDAQPPVVQADSRPVKEPPQQTSGKDSTHKNKLIYERLQNGDQPEAEHIVPRQEDVAMPAMPGAAPMTAPQAAPGVPAQVATVDDPNAADGGPRRVKTLVVRPDGSVMTPAATPAQSAPQPQQAAPTQSAPQQVAAAEPAMPAMPMPQPQAAPAQAPAPGAGAAAPAPVAADSQPVGAIPPAKPKVAVADAAPAPAKPSQFVVQVGSKQNQTEALATFADMQQKYPTLLANYRPMVQKADLGAKGVWYRLRIGPIVDKTAATKLCTQLKSQGHPDCLVMAAQ